MKTILKSKGTFVLKERFFRAFLFLLSFLLLTSCSQPPAPTSAERDSLKIVATVFPAYDFARAVGGEYADVSLLLPPGAESHSYEPTPADMLAVQDCDLFLYLGGESDAWVETILGAVDLKGTAVRMIDCVEPLEEETVEGMAEEPGHTHESEGDHHDLGAVKEYDEHVWTSPRNAALITRAIGATLMELDASHSAEYEANTERYAAEIESLDDAFADFFANCSNRTMLFGDRFPLRYFAEEYDIHYYAAFPGCSTQTEPSAATIAFLIDKAEAEHLSTIYYIEFSNHLVADSIAEATGSQTALFHTCHNVSQSELDSGATYVSLMAQNLEILRTTMD
jgi:zinc transport system substrate-binding protein